MADKDHAGSMDYPKKRSLNRFVYKFPLLLWRLGFGPLLGHPSRGGKKMMVLTTLGRKSKLPRHTMVSHISSNNKNYAISGWWQQADWVKNFHADPLVTIQTGNRIYSANAKRVEDLDEIKCVAQSLFDSGGDSHFGSWLESLQIEPSLEDLLDKRDRVFFVGFDPVDQEGPPPLIADLIWIWAVLISLTLGMIFFLW